MWEDLQITNRLLYQLSYVGLSTTWRDSVSFRILQISHSPKAIGTSLAGKHMPTATLRIPSAQCRTEESSNRLRREPLRELSWNWATLGGGLFNKASPRLERVLDAFVFRRQIRRS